MSFINVGVTGLNAANIGLQTTGHNITNASTAGFNRQVIVQGANISLFTGAGFVGQGVNVQAIKRVYSEHITGQLLSAQSNTAEMDSYLSQVQQIDNLLADSATGLSPALSQFFTALQETAANPSSLAARQSMLSQSEVLVERFHSLDQRLQEIRDGTNAQITSEVTLINSYAQEIAEVNRQLIASEAVPGGHHNNDLLDARDRLVADLNKEIRVTTLIQQDGQMSVFVGNGQPLVVGQTANSLVASADPEELERVMVGIKRLNADTGAPLPESMLNGGRLGGLIAFRGETLDQVQNSLGRIALTFAQNFNDQHHLGMDLSGALGGDFFDLSIAGPGVRANSNNSDPGAITATIADVGALSTSDYRLSYTGTDFVLTKLADNSNRSFASLPQTVDGMTIDLGTWNPTPGDSFLIQPTRAGARNLDVAIADTRAIAIAAPIRTAAALGNTGMASIDAGSVVDTANAAFATPGSLTPPILIRFDTATSYTIYDNSNPASPAALEGPLAYTTGADLFPTAGSLDYGYRVKISGTPAAGDAFTVAFNANGVADNRNGVALGALQTKSTVADGTATYQSAYAQVVSLVGNTTRRVEAVGKAQQSLVDQAQAARDRMSGVNLDEEAANLLRYQQAYQASAKMFDIAGRLFDEILALGR